MHATSNAEKNGMAERRGLPNKYTNGAGENAPPNKAHGPMVPGRVASTCLSYLGLVRMFPFVRTLWAQNILTVAQNIWTVRMFWGIGYWVVTIRYWALGIWVLGTGY